MVSIIMPTLNEADCLGYLLFSLSRQTYKNFEVIVSDGNSQDETIKIAKSFVETLYFALFGKYEAQKLIRRSYGDFGAFRKQLLKKRKTNRFLRGLNKKQFEELLLNLKNFFAEI